MKLSIPNLSLVALVGPSGSGKSTFAHKHFLPTEVLSSDACRGMVSDDENNRSSPTKSLRSCIILPPSASPWGGGAA